MKKKTTTTTSIAILISVAALGLSACKPSGDTADALEASNARVAALEVEVAELRARQAADADDQTSGSTTDVTTTTETRSTTTATTTTTPPTTTTSPATTTMPPTTTTSPATTTTTLPALTPDDIVIDLFVLESKCYHSAGASVTVEPEVTVVDLSRFDGAETVVVYEIYGGAAVERFNLTIEGGSYSFEEHRISTPTCSDTLTAKVVDVRPR